MKVLLSFSFKLKSSELSPMRSPELLLTLRFKPALELRNLREVLRHIGPEHHRDHHLPDLLIVLASEVGEDVVLLIPHEEEDRGDMVALQYSNILNTLLDSLLLAKSITIVP